MSGVSEPPMPPTVVQIGGLTPALDTELCRRYGTTVVGPTEADPAALAAFGPVRIAVTSGRAGVTAGMMDAWPNLGAIVTYGVGYEKTDVALAVARGIQISQHAGRPHPPRRRSGRRRADRRGAEARPGGPLCPVRWLGARRIPAGHPGQRQTGRHPGPREDRHGHRQAPVSVRHADLVSLAPHRRVVGASVRRQRASTRRGVRLSGRGGIRRP